VELVGAHVDCAVGYSWVVFEIGEFGYCTVIACVFTWGIVGEVKVVVGWILGNIPVDGVYLLPVEILPDYTPWDIPLQAGIGMGFSNLCVVGLE